MKLVPKAEEDRIFARYLVDDPTGEAPGTVIVDTRERLLYFVLPGRKAMRYGVAVGDEAYGWTGTARVARKAEWPDWNPPPEMKKRWPHVQYTMEGGPDNPLGARALYLHDEQRPRYALSNPRHQRAREDRPRGFVGLHPHAQHRRRRPLQPGRSGREGDRQVAAGARPSSISTISGGSPNRTGMMLVPRPPETIRCRPSSTTWP